MAVCLVDSHCHLDFDDLAERLPEVLERANAAGVRLMLTIGTRVKQFDRILAIAEAHEQVYCSVGTHPHNAGEETDVTAEHLARLARHPKVIAIGETGLDYHYDFAPRETQAASFRVHIAAARQTGLPLVVHSREAEDDTARMLESEMGQGTFKLVLHCFSSKRALAERGLAIGAYVSFSGILTFKAAEEIRETARLVPADRLLVETDAPYLAPAPHRGKPNEPAYAAVTMGRLAELRGMSKSAMAQVTSDNFFRLFDKAERPPGFGAAA
jgi:TatD DNase family protein